MKENGGFPDKTKGRAERTTPKVKGENSPTHIKPLRRRHFESISSSSFQAVREPTNVVSKLKCYVINYKDPSCRKSAYLRRLSSLACKSSSSLPPPTACATLASFTAAPVIPDGASPKA